MLTFPYSDTCSKKQILLLKLSTYASLESSNYFFFFFSKTNCYLKKEIFEIASKFPQKIYLPNFSLKILILSIDPSGGTFPKLLSRKIHHHDGSFVPENFLS